MTAGGALAAATLSASCAAVALWLSRPLPALPRAAALDAGAVGPLRAWVLALAAATAVLLGWLLLSPHALALSGIGAATAAGALRLVRRRTAAREAERRADLVLDTCEAMAADLASGQPPLWALRRAAREWPDLARVATAGDMGADVPAAFRELANRPGAGRLRTLAASWEVAHQTGSGLADAVARAADTVRADRRTARLVTAELASARATARMLAVLPVGVLLMGIGVGGDPVGFLVGTTAGIGCLAVGLALCWAGLLWLEAIADQVLRR